MDNERRPRVLVLTSTFPRWSDDSTPRFVHDLAVAASDAFDVTVLAPHHPGALLREQMGGLDVHRFRYFVPTRLERLCYGGGILANVSSSPLAAMQLPCFFGAELAAAKKMLATSAYDLVHAHWLLPQGLVAALACRRTPFVATVHGSDVLALHGPLFASLERRVARNATRVTVNSEATRDALLTRVPGTSPTMLPMAIADDWFSNVHERRSCASDTLLFVGRLSSEKGLDILIDAMPQIASRAPKARLVIVGDGPARASLAGRAVLRSVATRVVFRGALPQAELRKEHERACLFVAPSRSEGQGLAVIEAMASECPVVAARNAALSALVGGEERGWLCNPEDPIALADAVVRALASPAEAERRAKVAREFVGARYTWRVVREQLHSVYRDALVSGPRRASWA